MLSNDSPRGRRRRLSRLRTRRESPDGVVRRQRRCSVGALCQQVALHFGVLREPFDRDPLLAIKVICSSQGATPSRTFRPRKKRISRMLHSTHSVVVSCAGLPASGSRWRGPALLQRADRALSPSAIRARRRLLKQFAVRRLGRPNSRAASLTMSENASARSDRLRGRAWLAGQIPIARSP